MYGIKTIWKSIDGYKTYIVMFSAILFALTQYWSGAIDWNTCVTAILAALGAGSIRDGIQKLQNPRS